MKPPRESDGARTPRKRLKTEAAEVRHRHAQTEVASPSRTHKPPKQQRTMKISHTEQLCTRSQRGEATARQPLGGRTKTSKCDSLYRVKSRKSVLTRPWPPRSGATPPEAKLWGVYTRISTIVYMHLGNWAIIDCPMDQLTYCYYGRCNGKGSVFGPTCTTGLGWELQPGCGAEHREAKK